MLPFAEKNGGQKIFIVAINWGSLKTCQIDYVGKIMSCLLFQVSLTFFCSIQAFESAKPPEKCPIADSTVLMALTKNKSNSKKYTRHFHILIAIFSPC